MLTAPIWKQINHLPNSLPDPHTQENQNTQQFSTAPVARITVQPAPDGQIRGHCSLCGRTWGKEQINRNVASLHAAQLHIAQKHALPMIVHHTAVDNTITVSLIAPNQKAPATGIPSFIIIPEQILPNNTPPIKNQASLACKPNSTNSHTAKASTSNSKENQQDNTTNLNQPPAGEAIAYL